MKNIDLEVKNLKKEISKRDTENLRINNDLKRFKKELYEKEEEVFGLNQSISGLLKREQECNQLRKEAQDNSYEFQKQMVHLELENERAWKSLGVCASAAIILFGILIATILHKI